MFFDKEKELIHELYQHPTNDYYVKFKYHHKQTPDVIQELEFKQFDSEPFFPRINRFYEFCVKTMKDFNFVDYEVVQCFTPGLRYSENIENEFKIQ